MGVSTSILEFWSPSSYTLASFEIYLHNIKRVPMHLFDPAAKPPLIKLSDHGILGLEYDMYNLSDYDRYGD